MWLEKKEHITIIIDEYGGLPLEFEGLGMLLFTPLDYFVFQELLTYWGFYDEDEMQFKPNPYTDEAEELIRCKDCKWHNTDKDECWLSGLDTDGYEYCSWAERKEE